MMRTLFVVLGVLGWGVAEAVPMQLTHQGRLSDSGGVALEGTYQLHFKLYAEPAAGAPLWSDTLSVEVTGGAFSVVLGATGATPLDSSIFDGSARYLGLSVDAAPELPQRVVVVSVPYALRAGHAEVADSVSGGVVDASEIRVDGQVVIGADGVLSATVAWEDLVGVPAALDDGDDDTLASLGCSSGEVAVWDGAAWTCGAAAPSTVDVGALTGTIDIVNLPVGGGPTDVAAGDHVHSFGQITGELPLSRTIGELDAARITGNLPLSQTTGNLDVSRVTGNLPLSQTTGNLDVSRVTGNLPLSQTSGTLDASRLAGTIAFARLPTGTGANQVAPGDHTHSGLWTVTSGSLRAGSQAVVIGSGNPVAELTVEGGVRVGTAANTTCNATREGVLSWNSTAKALQVCNGTSWVGVSQGIARTCKELLTFNPASADGVYTLDPDGAGPGVPFQTWCDMANGGWTLLAKTEYSGLTGAERDAIRLGVWDTYSVTGYGNPAAASRIFWMPLVHWNVLTLAYPNNVFRITDSVTELRMSNLSIGNATQEHPINWASNVSGYQQIHGNRDNAIKGMRFTTRDNDNDVWGQNCAVNNVGQNGGFWYSDCYQSSMLHANGNLYSWRSNVDTTVTYNRLWFREE